MPTPNPRVQVTFEPSMYSKIVQLAAAEDRSLSNFIEHHLRRMLGPKLEPIFTPAQQVDIEQEIARSKRQRSKSPKRK